MGFTHVDKNLPFARAEGRIATKSYGIPKYITFDDSEHERVRRVEDDFSGKYCIEVMEWFIKQGTSMKESDKINISLQSKKTKEDYRNDGEFHPMVITICQHDSINGAPLPKHKTQDVKAAATLTARLDRIPEDRFKTEFKVNGEAYYVAEFDVEVCLNSANVLSCRMCHANTDYGEESVEVKFL